MNRIVLFVSAVLMTMPLLAQSGNEEYEVRETVQSFYADFNSHRWEHAAEYTTEDWVHINPLGGCTRGREAVLKELHEVHSTFLKGVSDRPEEISVLFASPEVAIATVISGMTTYTTPDGVQHANEQHIRTFVLVKRNARWRIIQDQNTTVVTQTSAGRR